MLPGLSEEDPVFIDTTSKRGRTLDCDDEVSDTNSYTSVTPKKIKVIDLPGAIRKRQTEKPLPHPFPLPVNFHHDVELCLKSSNMTAAARKHFLSAIASAMFSFKRYYYCIVSRFPY